jgi:osmoprotectant transport system ATP-binding protein
VLAVEGVARSFGASVALAPTTLAFEAGCTTVLIGPSGCGKTTLLRLLLGLIRPDAGRVMVDGQPLTSANALAMRHRIGYVIQEGGLFPHFTAAGNVALLARHLRRKEGWIAERLRELAQLVRLPQDLLDRYPAALSGGQRQRVALMRALMLDAPILLMDEPLAALDPMTRAGLQADLKEVFARMRKTVVLVTHDMHEALHFADRVVLMRAGKVIQDGAPDALLTHPSDAFVTEFVRAQRVDARLAG